MNGGNMLDVPYYLHDYKKFDRITLLGEFLAVASILMCFLYLLIHLGQPMRALNLFFHPTPWSMLFWDGNVLFCYLALNLIIGWKVLEAEKNGVAPPSWVKQLIYLSIPMAFSIHTVTAFIYCGLPGRGFWLWLLEPLNQVDIGRQPTLFLYLKKGSQHGVLF
jgi:molybdopterin-containing oxidoreductase family membrane subunit